MNVRGKLIPLSNGRLVYVGTDRDKGDNSLFIAFRNAEGEDTKLRLSPEAAVALKYAMKCNGDHYDAYPFKGKWVAVGETIKVE